MDANTCIYRQVCRWVWVEKLGFFPKPAYVFSHPHTRLMTGHLTLFLACFSINFSRICWSIWLDGYQARGGVNSFLKYFPKF